MASSYLTVAAAINFILILFTSTHLNISIAAARKLLSSDSDTEFIKTSCGATVYPDLCLTTYSSYATEIKANPKILAAKSLSLTLNTTRSASKFLSELCKRQDLKPREAQALKDCAEQVGDSVDELKRSIGEMDETQGKSFEFRMSDIETWVSAALTDDDSCMDGFTEKSDDDGDVKDTVKKEIEKVAHMTSIALAFVNRYAGSHN